MSRSFFAFATCLSLLAAPALRAQGRGGAQPAGPLPRIEERTGSMQKIDGYLDLVAKVTPDASLNFAGTYVYKNNGGTNPTLAASLPTFYTDETLVWARSEEHT